MPAGRNKRPSPRAVGGGRSPRYAERRAQRGTVGSRAPEWGDAAASEVLRVLSDDCLGANLLGHCISWLPQAEGHAKFVRRLKLSPADREKASEILGWHSAKMCAATDPSHGKLCKGKVGF